VVYYLLNPTNLLEPRYLRNEDTPCAFCLNFCGRTVHALSHFPSLLFRFVADVCDVGGTSATGVFRLAGHL
ncbi:hypothetical protein M9Y22_20860, partial [Escherichia coli]|nr:hypothetical protein [Escherichia coli]